MALVFLSHILPRDVQSSAAFIGFLSMLGGISGQFRADYMYSILMAALEKAESSNQAMPPTAGRSDA